MWEIAENLHRADLTAEQRHAWIRRYAELLEAEKPGHYVRVSDAGGRGNVGMSTRSLPGQNVPPMD
jgi:hypothetical protein